MVFAVFLTVPVQVKATACDILYHPRKTIVFIVFIVFLVFLVKAGSLSRAGTERAWLEKTGLFFIKMQVFCVISKRSSTIFFV